MINTVYIEYIGYLLQIILIVLSIMIVLTKKNGNLVVLIASFGFVTASLYLINKAPDVAIAEIAIGTAIIPLIYIISITKQKNFTVINKTLDDFLVQNDDFSGIGAIILNQLADFYKLKLTITDDTHLCYLSNEMDRVVCQKNNIDMIVQKNEKTGHYTFKGKETNILLKKLETLCIPYENISVSYIEESDFYD